MKVVTVALAGTPEAADTDFVCDGTDDQVKILAAIRLAGESGGGTVQLGAGTYSVSAPIKVGHDNVTDVLP
ncbi:MAG: hypothetical protein ACEQSH_00875 [Bacteroidia bacterium]